MEIIKFNGRLVVRSLDFYRQTGMRSDHYTRWMRWYVFPIGDVKNEIIVAEDNYIPYKLNGEKTREKLRYYFTLDFAKSLCIWIKTKEARILRHELNKMADIEKKYVLFNALMVFLDNYRDELKDSLVKIENHK